MLAAIQGVLKHLGQRCSPLRFIAQLPDTLVLEILTDDNKPLKSRCFPWRQIKQENAGLQKESMSVLNHVSSLDHWAFTHVKMDYFQSLWTWALIRSQTMYMSRERIIEFTWERKEKSHTILFSFVFNF